MRLALLHPQTMFLEALADTLATQGHHVLTASADLEQVVDVAARERPDLCLVSDAAVDVAVRELRGVAPATRLVLLLEAMTDTAHRLLRTGHVHALVSERSSLPVLVQAMEQAHRGGLPAVRGWTLDGAGPVALTGREREVVALLVGGASTAEMAHAMKISEFTVRGHVQSLLRKLGVSRRSQVAARAAELGLVETGLPR